MKPIKLLLITAFLFIVGSVSAQTGAELLIKGNRATLERDYPLAISYYSEYIKLNPDDFRGYFNRGTTEYNAGMYSNAIEDFTTTLFHNPIYKEAYYYRGQCYQEQSLYDMAISDYSYVLNTDSFSVPFLKLRAEAYSLSNQESLALEDLNTAIEVNKLSGDLYKRRAELKVKLKDVDGALRDYSSVQKLLPSYKMVHYIKGNLYLQIAETEFACEEFEEALDNKIVVAERDYQENCGISK